MSNRIEQKKSSTEVKDRTKVRKEKLAGFFFDLAKLTFAALVLGGLSPIISNNAQGINWISIIAGSLATYFFASFANRILK